METSIQDKYTVSVSEQWEKKKILLPRVLPLTLAAIGFTPDRRGVRGEWSADNSHRLYKPCNTTA